MKYLHPKSLTWWSGLVSLVLGGLMIYCTQCEVAQLAELLSVLNGGSDASPVGMIVMGLGLIGLRDKLERI